MCAVHLSLQSAGRGGRPRGLAGAVGAVRCELRFDATSRPGRGRAAFDLDAARRQLVPSPSPSPLTQTNEFLGRAVVRPRVVLTTPEAATHPAVPGSEPEPEPESDAQSDRAGRGPRWARGWGQKWGQWRSGSWMGARRPSPPPPQPDGAGGGPSLAAGGGEDSAHGNEGEGEGVGVHWISMMSGSRRTGDVLAAVQLVQVCGRKPTAAPPL